MLGELSHICHLEQFNCQLTYYQEIATGLTALAMTR